MSGQKTEAQPGFDARAFEKTRFVPRTDDVWVDALFKFFPPCEQCGGTGKTPDGTCRNCRGIGARAVITVRNLHGEEVAKVREEVERNRAAARAAEEARKAGAGEEAVRAVRVLLGVSGDNVPDEHARHISLVHMGCVAPKVSQGTSVKMAQHFPIEHAALAQRILQLTGLGSVEKKK